MEVRLLNVVCPPDETGPAPLERSWSKPCVWRIADFPENQQFATHRFLNTLLRSLQWAWVGASLSRK